MKNVIKISVLSLIAAVLGGASVSNAMMEPRLERVWIRGSDRDEYLAYTGDVESFDLVHYQILQGKGTKDNPIQVPVPILTFRFAERAKRTNNWVNLDDMFLSNILATARALNDHDLIRKVIRELIRRGVSIRKGGA